MVRIMIYSLLVHYLQCILDKTLKKCVNIELDHLFSDKKQSKICPMLRSMIRTCTPYLEWQLQTELKKGGGSSGQCFPRSISVGPSRITTSHTLRSSLHHGSSRIPTTPNLFPLIFSSPFMLQSLHAANVLLSPEPGCRGINFHGPLDRDGRHPCPPEPNRRRWSWRQTTGIRFPPCHDRGRRRSITPSRYTSDGFNVF